MGSKNYTDVLIGGKIYTLGGLEEESYLQQVASYINEKLEELRRQSGFLKQSEDYQSVMVYLNLADDYFKEREHARVLADQKEELEKETYSLKHELVGTQMRLETALDGKTKKERSQEAAERETKAMETEISELRRKLAEAEADATEAGNRADGLREELEGLKERVASAEQLPEKTKERPDDAEYRAMKEELEKYRALEAARNSSRMQKGHR